VRLKTEENQRPVAQFETLQIGIGICNGWRPLFKSIGYLLAMTGEQNTSSRSGRPRLC
jgi:hypothetical protein